MITYKESNKSILPIIKISLSKIRENTRVLSELYGQKGISIMGVSKAVLGEDTIVNEMVQGGVRFIADSRIKNIQKIKNSGTATQCVLMRTQISQAESVIKYADISLNTEIETIKKLAFYAKIHNQVHRIILMVELGDLREGILPGDLSLFVKKILPLTNIKIIGIGCNLACYGGVKPDSKNMLELSELAKRIEKKFQINLEIISGGNSANYEWFKSAQDVHRINNIRIGESIFLGCETLNRKAIPGLHRDAFQLVAEVIESKKKPSLPYGNIGQDAFGNVPSFKDCGIHQRVIIALGRQDVPVSGLKPDIMTEILGSSSDHIILHNRNYPMQVGDEVSFNLDYSGLLAAMTSPFIQKQFLY